MSSIVAFVERIHLLLSTRSVPDLESIEAPNDRPDIHMD